ncbi:MAG: hypothetical protein J0I32_23305 [Sphingobacteriales bacterium]|nr:hypothetical protein [Sphingobacteriales bacterium]OJW01969.1 MAG: hypothetical protein BGO52_00355 [Sphingobacteriales bacterium 44-61]
MKRKLIVTIICLLLFGLFLYTSASKFLAFNRFYDELNNQPLPNVLTPIIVWALPITEIILSLLLMSNKTQRIGLWGSFILMSLFTIYTGLVLLRTFERVPCSCGGVISSLTWPQHLVFNLFFTGISLAGIMLTKQNNAKLKNITYTPVT